jgi:endonuclease-3
MILASNQKRALRQLNLLKNKSSSMKLAAEGWGAAWKTLIAISMSAQSRDEITIVIAAKLFKKFPSIKKLAAADYFEVLHILKSLNYNRTKAKNIIACAKIILDKHGGRVPLDFDQLIELPGVGRKTANVFLSEYGFDAIGIDTHAAYVSKKLRWTNNNSPNKIENDLGVLFPKKYWSKINPILVRFGKTYTSKKIKDRILDEILDST